MKYLIDAQLPRRLAQWMGDVAGDAIHTLDMPDGNRSTDIQIIELADREFRVVVTKDADFVNQYTLHGRPAKLLLISTGNMNNLDLEKLIRPLIPILAQEFEVNAFLELSPAGIVVRG